ncbi:sulfate reduction electron transfer complex DsrMKJOP subunit DsrO [Azospirillum halopraeferens]|uniref:sulfate reduction electron transfer complex DsrMKJOP subunit DsrO n=1 Tax=Azospirillum halopraeferens TaxID=34010 RepID=UPI0004051DC0|nr:4Fe-4S dicluster domain-containing protein [Azospirillum halopraeferens]
MKDVKTPPSAEGRGDTVSRRSLLGAALAAVTLAPGITLYAGPAAAAADGAKRWGLLIDTTRCDSGCSACVTACGAEHGWSDAGRARPDQAPQWVRKVDVRDPATGRTASLPIMCQHCAKPPCVDVCPTGASFKRADGIVLVDRHICIGCRYCMMACPYKARSFVHEPVTGQRPGSPRGMGTVEACNLCVTRVDAGGRPVCVDACAGAGRSAILFGDLDDPGSAISRRIREVAPARIRDDLRLDTGVYYQGI